MTQSSSPWCWEFAGEAMQLCFKGEGKHTNSNITWPKHNIWKQGKPRTKCVCIFNISTALQLKREEFLLHCFKRQSWVQNEKCFESLLWNLLVTHWYKTKTFMYWLKVITGLSKDWESDCNSPTLAQFCTHRNCPAKSDPEVKDAMDQTPPFQHM